jgi:hypothetical protein
MKKFKRSINIKMKGLGGINLQKYFGIVSVAIVIITFIILLLGTGEISGLAGINILWLGVSLAIISAVFSTKTWRSVLLIVYGIPLVLFIITILGIGIAHM